MREVRTGEIMKEIAFAEKADINMGKIPINRNTSDPSENSKNQENTFYLQESIDANKFKNISFILRTNEDKEPTIKIGEGYFWYRGEKIEDTKNVYELFADYLQKQRCNY